MMWRFPDKPTTSSPGVLPMLKDGDWLCQIKFDGWRCLARWDGRDLTFTSRERKALPVSANMVKALYDAVHELPPCLLDGEWMCRRDNQPEGVRLFDILEEDGQWLGGLNAADRWLRFSGLVAGRVDGDLVGIVPCTDRGYAEWFEWSKELPGAEGVVLKHKTSTYIGSVRRSVDNPLWLKAKWREGFDGQLRVA